MSRLVLILVTTLLLGCGGQKKKEAPAEAPEIPRVETVKLEPAVWHQSVRTFGVFEAAEEVILSADFSAKVNKVEFKEGQKINAGHIMVEFDKARQRMESQQAATDIANVLAKLENARAQYERRKELMTEGSISQEQLEAVQINLSTWETRYEQSLIGKSLAHHNLRRTRLLSPVSGRVVSRNIEVGETAMPGQALAVIHVTDTMRVLTHATEKEINAIQVGARCSVSSPGVRGWEYVCHVEQRGGEADPATGNFPVRLTVENQDGLLKPGMTAVVKLSGLEVSDAMLLPASAVVDRNRQRVVFKVEQGKAVEVVPVLAAAFGDDVQPVLHGLQFGDQIIVGGLRNVVDGTPVKVVADNGKEAGKAQ